MGGQPDQVPASPDAVVREVATEAHLNLAALRPEEQAYLKDHALKKPLRVTDIWALGVGAVISGAYFGWNLGLKDNGPVAMLVASLVVCLLYLTWVLALSELSVAMPFAGGPLAYGRRAFSPGVGFVMGWSMLLECQFAAIAAALATGGYIAFLVNPEAPNPAVRVTVALATVAVFHGLHAWGVKEQSRAMMAMTYAAILGLLIFWLAAAPSFSGERVWPRPALPDGKGWWAVLEAIPFALWWLVGIETVALAAEEAREAHRTIPRGLVLAQVTLVAIVVLTWLFACGALNSRQLAVTEREGAAQDVDYPLLKAIGSIPAGRSLPLFYGFGVIAISGIIASYHGLVFGTGRQVFSLGRAGYLPSFLGRVHATRRTPVAALRASNLLAVGFIVASLWWEDVGTDAVLVSTLTALVWYVLAVSCLFALRRREPGLFVDYRIPVYRLLPVTVVLLAVLAAYLYGVVNAKVVPLTAALYALGLGYYGVWGRGRIQKAAPEELAVRTAAGGIAAPKPRYTFLERVTAAVLVFALLGLGGVVLAAPAPTGTWPIPADRGVVVLIALLSAALGLVSAVALLHTRPRRKNNP